LLLSFLTKERKKGESNHEHEHDAAFEMNDRGGGSLSAGVRAMALDDRARASHGAAAKKSTSRVEFRDASGPASTSYDRDRSSSAGAAAALRQPARDAPIFALETLERNANRGGGIITTGAAANNCVVVGTSRGTCVFYDFADGTSVEIDCALGTSSSASSAAAGSADVAVGRVWLDPTARHAIATLHDGLNRPVDTVYFQPATATRTPRARPLPLVAAAGVAVTAVGWHHARCAHLAAADVLVGTHDGALFELSLDASPPASSAASSAFKKSSSSSSSSSNSGLERVFRKLLELTEAGLHK
jgi:hypothetical protein